MHEALQSDLISVRNICHNAQYDFLNTEHNRHIYYITVYNSLVYFALNCEAIHKSLKVPTWKEAVIAERTS